ncbi:prephenate dehydrogenase/arogenate dehydrogenase family protein [Microvirga puerhi]|uniref:Prephenate dehydrogenase/arogenate dehydrogenase family protein n=1 Tax=Microvirga puerhi TaxID=2876078 RepID=A0ABS7VL02_9HYPH|nr:prephenate dehydrogenase/arogenate dehydrogenase family protein [Microvirga puerhi]MBZ6076213.1 prephenate dehydrogenase/arogenate dehydrogenase family protein [Microvirga puerhi]
MSTLPLPSSPVDAHVRMRPTGRRRSLAIVGVGAFGEFCIEHLKPFFDLLICDPKRDLTSICQRWDVASVDLETAARQDIVLLAVPLRSLRMVVRAMAPHMRAGSLVIDVCSVKIEPLAILTEELPKEIHLVGTHPLFGPQSGRNGIAGLRIALCAPGSVQGMIVARFLRRHLALDVIKTTAETHDRQMAYVQGLTHLLGRVAATMDLPHLDLATASFVHLRSMMEMVRHDSDELFRTIVLDNPYGREVMSSFVSAAREVLQPVSLPSSRML